MSSYLNALDPEHLIAETLVEEDALQARISELGEQLSRDYEGLEPLLVGVLKGAVFFMADLVRRVTVPCEMDFMAVSSYGSGTDSSGVVRILKDLDANIEGRHVVIIEDIVDSGSDAVLPGAESAGALTGHARGVRASDQARAPADRHHLPLRRASRSPTGSRSATASTTASATAASPTWPPWTSRACPRT